MKQKTIWLVVAAGIAGITFYMLRRKRMHRRWEKQRSEVLSKAKRYGHGEFVI